MTLGGREAQKLIGCWGWEGVGGERKTSVLFGCWSVLPNAIGSSVVCKAALSHVTILSHKGNSPFVKG